MTEEGSGNHVAVTDSCQKKQYSVREQFYQHLPWHNEVPKTNGTTTVTIPKIINLNFASDMLHFIWPWDWMKRNITGSGKGVHSSHETMWDTQPNHFMITTELLFGHGCLTWFDDDHKKFNCTTEAQGHYMLPSKKLSTNWYLHRHWNKIIWHVYKELKSQAFITNLFQKYV